MTKPAVGRLVVPEQVEQSVSRQDLAGFQEQEPEQAAFPPPSEVNETATVFDLHRAEKPEVHLDRRVAGLARGVLPRVAIGWQPGHTNLLFGVSAEFARRYRNGMRPLTGIASGAIPGEEADVQIGIGVGALES